MLFHVQWFFDDVSFLSGLCTSEVDGEYFPK